MVPIHWTQIHLEWQDKAFVPSLLPVWVAANSCLKH